MTLTTPTWLRNLRARVANIRRALDNGVCPDCGTGREFEPATVAGEEVWGAAVRWMEPAAYVCPECGRRDEVK